MSGAGAGGAGAHDPALVDDLVAFACERRVGDFIDTDRIMRVVDAALTAERTASLWTRFVVPARERILAAGRASHIPLKRWLPESVFKALDAWLAHPVKVPRWVIDEIVTSEGVRDEVRDMLEETISDMLKKGGSGFFGLGVRAAGAAARGIFGGVGDTVQRGLEDRMRDLLGGGVAMAQRRIARKLASKDTARDLGKRRRQLFRRLVARTEHDAARVLADLPWSIIDAAVGPVVAHNLERPEVRAAVRAEIEAALAELSKQTIGEWLDKLGLRDQALAWARERGASLAEEFTAWRAARATAIGTGAAAATAAEAGAGPGEDRGER